MKLLRGFVGFVGILVVAGAIYVAADPTLNLAAPAVDALGNDYLVVAIPAALAIIVVLLGLLVRGLTGQTQATPPDPEGVPTVPVFGDDVDAFIAGRPSVRTHLLGDAPAAMHARLREAAIRTEMLANGVSREAATAVVDDGRWTADREAAAFCQLDGVRGSHLGGRLSAALRGRTWAQYGAARTAAALVERSEAGQTPSTGEPATAAADGGSP